MVGKNGRCSSLIRGSSRQRIAPKEVLASSLPFYRRPPFSRTEVVGLARVNQHIINGEHVRRKVSTRQRCARRAPQSQEWPCGRTAAEWLRDHLHGRQVDCVGHARDRYDRLLAVCYVDGESVNDRLVGEGWALDFRKYSTDCLGTDARSRTSRCRSMAWIVWTVRTVLGVAKRALLRMTRLPEPTVSPSFADPPSMTPRIHAGRFG
jgi:hypothetical protein